MGGNKIIEGLREAIEDLDNLMQGRPTKGRITHVRVRHVGDRAIVSRDGAPDRIVRVGKAGGSSKRSVKPIPSGE